jgi:hypothetical protein
MDETTCDECMGSQRTHAKACPAWAAWDIPEACRCSRPRCPSCAAPTLAQRRLLRDLALGPMTERYAVETGYRDGVVERLVAQGRVTQVANDDGERWYEITDAGRAALDAKQVRHAR